MYRSAKRCASTLTPAGVPKTQRGVRGAPGRALCCSSKHHTYMTYLRDLERELKALLNEGDDARVLRFVKEKALESYRNGLDAVSLRVDQAAQKLERPVRPEFDSA
jgi:hypothetical protein